MGPSGHFWKNIYVDHFGPFWTPLDHFEMLTSLPCLAIFVCFIGAVYLGHPLPKIVWLSATEGEIGKGGGNLGDLTTGQKELKLRMVCGETITLENSWKTTQSRG